jgi:Zn-dependent M28 family amino/carboxypeptidase
MPFAVRAAVRVDRGRLRSENVVAVLSGSDSELKSEHVVLTAHLDHLGVGAAVAGDRVYNGAMDNAAGIATLIETARSLAKSPPARSVVFAAVTAEEHGLLGSRYFTANPGVPRSSVAASVNMDMFLPIHPMRVLTAIGLEESTLSEPLARVAARTGVTAEGDPEPLRNRFIRSDQYNFVKIGVPALALKLGYEKGSVEEAAQREWMKTRYHAPSDDLEQPVDLEAAQRFNEVVRELVREIANQPERPRWRQSSFFRRFTRY